MEPVIEALDSSGHGQAAGSKGLFTLAIRLSDTLTVCPLDVYIGFKPVGIRGTPSIESS